MTLDGQNNNFKSRKGKPIEKKAKLRGRKYSENTESQQNSTVYDAKDNIKPVGKYMRM